MKRRLSWFGLVALVILTIAGCKQKFEVTGQYKETPVIYGLLNYQTAPNYIRIQKGYLLQGNAYLAAGISDSIYYPNILKVQLTAVGTGQVINLSRVDGNTLGLPKDSGLFSSTPNWLYVTPGRQPLDSTQTYQLTVIDTVSNDTASAQTTLVHGLTIYAPFSGQVISLSDVAPFNLNCSNPGAIYDITVRIFYYELNNATGTVVGSDSIDLPVWRSIIPQSGSFTLQPIPITKTDVLNFLAGNLAVNTNVKRKFRKMNFLVSSGGQDLATFLTSQQAQSGIASSNSLPPYTNITNGVGLLSSRVFQEVDSVLLDQNGLDSLACGSQTSNLRFENSVGQICY